MLPGAGKHKSHALAWALPPTHALQGGHFAFQFPGGFRPPDPPRSGRLPAAPTEAKIQICVSSQTAAKLGRLPLGTFGVSSPEGSGAFANARDTHSAARLQESSIAQTILLGFCVFCFGLS